jgi:hypothetical protein
MIEPTLVQQREAEAALFAQKEESIVVKLDDKDDTDVTNVDVFFFNDDWVSLAQEARAGSQIVVLSPAQAYALWLSLQARYA